MEAVFLHIVNIAITASWLVLAVLLLRFALKKAPKWATCLLWGIVALRLILPFSLESALSLIPNAEPIPQEIIITGTPTVNNGLEGAYQVPDQVPGQVGDSVIPDSLAPVPGDSVDPVQVLVFAASIVWISGILLMLSYGAVSYFRLKYKVRASLVKEGRVYLCDNIDTPFILGIFRPRIYLPSGMAESEIPYVIAHEEAHLKRQDHLWKPLGFLLLAVYWFNPLLWVGYILLCRDIENACDEKAIKDSNKAYKVSYSEALLACSIHRRTVMACPLAFGEVGVKSRIRAVLHYKKPAFWVIVVAIVAIIVTCVCFFTNPVTDQDETTTAPSTTETPVTTGKTPAINLPSDPFAFHELGPTIYSGVYENGNRWFLATVTGVTSDSVLVKPHDECDESELYTSENPLILPKSLYKNAFQDESQVAYLQIGDEIRVSYQGEIGTAKFVSFGWMYFSTIRSITTADLNQDGVKEEYINAWGFASGLYDGRLVIRDPAGQKTWLYCIYHESPLVGVIDIVTDSDGRVILYGSVNSEKVALGEILYQKERDYFYIDMYNSTTPENPDAWKEKVVWESLKHGYNAKTDTYQIRIIVQDIHGVGQKNADAAFAEKYGLLYDGKYYLSYYMFDIDATMEEIEIYAKLEEVKSIEYPLPPDVPSPGITVDTYLDNAWWQEIQTDYRGFWQRSPDGAWHYIWPMTLKEKSNFFPKLPEDHPVYPGKHTLELTTAEGAFAYIKDVNKDKDYTKYMVTGWTVNGYDLAFEAEGFVPTADGVYDMLLFFVAPEYSTHPGEYVYVWGLGETWYFNLPSILEPMAYAAES